MSVTHLRTGGRHWRVRCPCGWSGQRTGDELVEILRPPCPGCGESISTDAGVTAADLDRGVELAEEYGW